MKTNNMVTFACTLLATLFILNACDNGSGGYNNIGSGEKYDYCVFMEQQTCLSGPFETCANGGTPSNSCPSGYDTGSQVEKPSSSSINSVGVVNSSSSAVQQTGKIEGTPVTYQGKTYKTVVIGSQVWMAENLNYNVTSSKCYGEDGLVWDYDAGDVVLTNAEIQANCAKYGRLYNWATAMALDASCNSTTCASLISEKHQGICPSGRHIPSDDEWDELINAVGGDSTAGTYLKATSGWNDNGNGEDTHGFSALPGGGRLSSGLFNLAANSAYFWSATENYASVAGGRRLYYNDEGMPGHNYSKNYLQSVRCVRD